MKFFLASVVIIFSLYFSLGTVYSEQDNRSVTTNTEQSQQADSKIKEISIDLSTAIFAGGCFWCVEADFEKLEGVSDAVSGYTGGSAETADYKTVSHTETGHYEAVQVFYDPAIVSYSELVEYFWKTIDPSDPDGQFCDKGSSYQSAIFYSSDEEKKTLDESIDQLKINKPFKAPIATKIIAAAPFYNAEKYHQSYYKKNPIRYKYYRNGCRRDQKLKKLWGEKHN